MWLQPVSWWMPVELLERPYDLHCFPEEEDKVLVRHGLWRREQEEANSKMKQ